MPRLIIQNLFNTQLEIIPEAGSVLQQAHQQHLDWMHACGGRGRCTSCKMIVLSGAENLSPLSPSECKFRDLGRLQANERQACQCRVLTGEVVVRIPRLYQLPHLQYSE